MMWGNSAEQVAQLTNAITRRVTSDTGMRAELAEREAHDETVNQTTIFTDGLGRQEREEVSRTANEAVTASRQYQEAQAAAQRVGSETRLTSPQMGLLIAGNSGVMEELKRTVARHGRRGLRSGLPPSIATRVRCRRDQADAAAAMSLLYGSNQPAQFAHAPKDRADAGRRRTPLRHGRWRLQRLGDRPVQPAAAHRWGAKIGRGTGCLCRRTPIGCLGRCPSPPGSVAMERARTQSTLAGGREAVESAGAANREQVHDGFAARQADLRADKREELGRRIRQQAGLARPLARWTHEEVGGLLRNTARIVGNVGSAVGSASDAATSFARTLAETKIRERRGRPVAMHSQPRQSRRSG